MEWFWPERHSIDLHKLHTNHYYFVWYSKSEIVCESVTSKLKKNIICSLEGMGCIIYIFFILYRVSN